MKNEREVREEDTGRKRALSVEWLRIGSRKGRTRYGMWIRFMIVN